jgi:hypothetical protein
MQIGGYARGSIIGVVTLRNERTMSSQADLNLLEPSPRASLRHHEHRWTVSAMPFPMSYIHLE